MNNTAAAFRRAGEPPKDRASQLRGFGSLGLSAIFVIFSGAAISPLLSTALILIWVVLSHTPWHEIGYARPESWKTTVTLAVLGGAAFKLVLKAIIMPLLGAAPANAAYHYLSHNPAGMVVILFYILAGAGFAEETFFRGYLFERLRKLLGPSIIAKGAIVLLTAALFGIAHYRGQGVDGVKQASIVGLVFGAIFAATGRLFPLMIAHAAFDVTAAFLIYFDIEAKVAHFLLK
jgi:membrane protease YdiL (CAAX protease family)